MAAFNKFNNFVQNLGAGAMNLTSDTIKVMLTNTTPVATNSVYADVSGTELANGNGYTTGGGTVSGVTYTNSSGTSTLTGNAFTWTSGPSNMGPFQYVIAYDFTASTKPLIGWWNNGTPITLVGADGDQFVWSPTGNIIFTIS